MDGVEGAMGRGYDEVPRVLGHIQGKRPGPTLIAMGGLHGNEPSGILALQRVLEALAPRAAHLSGDFIALSGNRGALVRNRRFLGRDLNRLWTSERINALRGIGQGTRPEGGPTDPEDVEQEEILLALDQALATARGDVFFLDLHTTSGPGEPFSTIADPASSRAFALNIPVPLILGLGEMLEGTLTGYLTDLGIPAVVFEGGQHGSPGSVVSSEAGVWLSLVGAGMIPQASFPEVARSWEHLRTLTRGLPPVLRMEYRHPLGPDDEFRMLPGFESFQVVECGQVVAQDRNGEVACPMAGRLLMPLYQSQGEDGFFLIREVDPRA